jgi:RNA recognition motif-containing protein
MEKTIRVDHENPIIEPLRSVFVGNLPFKISDDEVRLLRSY